MRRKNQKSLGGAERGLGDTSGGLRSKQYEWGGRQRGGCGLGSHT